MTVMIKIKDVVPMFSNNLNWLTNVLHLDVFKFFFSEFKVYLALLSLRTQASLFFTIFCRFVVQLKKV